jgi:AcrR family transcriptional regulator
VIEINITDRAEKRRSARVDGLLAVAERLVGEVGIEHLTLGRLAAEVAVVPAALYRYFDSKDALLAALELRTVERLRAQFTERVRQSDEPLARVVAAAHFYLELPEGDPAAHRLLTHLLGDPRPLLADVAALRVAPAMLAFLADVSALFEEAAAAGALCPGDSERRALALWGALQGINQLGKLARFDAERFDARRLGGVAVRALLAGWGASDTALDAADLGRDG